MVDTPELTSMTRRKTVRPLVAAWVFVIVLLGTGFIWLSFTTDTEPVQKDTPDAVVDHNVDNAQIAMTTPPDVTGKHEIIKEDVGISVHLEASETPDEKYSFSNGLSLIKAPIDGLTIMGANGPLPVLGPDSMVAWKEYARPSGDDGADTDDRPKLAIIITGIGLNSKSTELAIKKLPGQIDLGFSPYGRGLQKWMNRAREAGHEGFLMIPTEPVSYPDNDPGPHTLLAGASPRDNLKKLDWLLSQVTGYVGVINEMGSKFTTSEADLLPILEDLNGRGLMLVDARSTRFSVAGPLAQRISMPRAINNRYIDNTVSSVEITRSLTALENTARTYGAALGVAHAFPLTIEEIAKWAHGLEARGIRLVPVTAIANRQPIR